MKINEIFYSLQGEGRFTGTAAVFVRFAGCNMQCGFCDTNHRPYTVYSEDEILQEIARYPAKRVVLTGGEPTLQLTKSFIDLLHAHGYKVNLETNGTRPLPTEDIDWVVCSPKGSDIRLQRIDELKVVYQHYGQPMGRYETMAAREYYIQPCDTKDERHNRRVIEDALTFIKLNPKWKLSLQTQKLLGIR